MKETLPDASAQLRFGQTGEPGPQVRGTELPREFPHFPRKLQLAIGGHFPKAVDLPSANLRVHSFHAVIYDGTRTEAASRSRLVPITGN
jgi:hypothetical protein